MGAFAPCRGHHASLVVELQRMQATRGNERAESGVEWWGEKQQEKSLEQN